MGNAYIPGGYSLLVKVEKKKYFLIETLKHSEQKNVFSDWCANHHCL